MNEFGLKAKDATIADLGLRNVEDAYWNLTPAELVEETIIRGEGMLTDTGALAVDTGCRTEQEFRFFKREKASDEVSSRPDHRASKVAGGSEWNRSDDGGNSACFTSGSGGRSEI